MACFADFTSSLCSVNFNNPFHLWLNNSHYYETETIFDWRIRQDTVSPWSIQSAVNFSRRVAEVLCWPAWNDAEFSLETDLSIQSHLPLPHHWRTDLYPQGCHGSNGERPFMVVVLPREELCPGLVRGCPLSLRQSRRRQRLEKRIVNALLLNN